DWIGYLRFWDRGAARPARKHRRHRRHRHRHHRRRVGHRRARAPDVAVASGTAAVASRTAAPPPVSSADAVIVSMPGFLAGAADFDQLARHVIEEAAARGRHVEFWALDRRANCLEDHRGTDAAARAHDYLAAVRYYFHGQPIDGH